NAYTRGHSEKIIGDHIGRDPRKRERLVLATRFFASLYLGDPNAAAPTARPSTRSSTTRCAACRPTTWTCTGCTHGIASPHRRDDARARRPHPRGQGPLHRLLGHAGVQGRPGPPGGPA